MKQLILSCTALFSAVTSQDLPPQDGKFFYTDFTQVGPYGMHSASLLISDERLIYDVFVTTNEQQLGIVTSNCRKYICDTPQSLEVAGIPSVTTVDGNYNQ